MADNSNYYYEQPIDEVGTTTTTTTTTEIPQSTKPSKFPIILLIIVGIILFAALFLLIFQSPATTTTNNTTTTTTEKVRLQFRGAFIAKDIIQPLINEYQTLNPNVTIEYADTWPDGEYSVASEIYRSNLNRDLRESDPTTVPDIFMVQNSWVGDYDGIYSEPSANFDYNTYKSTFYPAVVTDFAQDGLVHGVPLWIDTLAILYNKDILAKAAVTSPPTDWNTFKTLAKSLTVKDGTTIKQSGFAAGLASNVSYAFELSNLLLYQNQVPPFDSNGNFTLTDSPTTLSTFQFFKSFTGTSGTWDSSMDNDAAAFLEGKVAMIMATSYRYRDILKYNKAYDINLNIGVAPMPQVSTKPEDFLDWSNYWGAMVVSSSARSKANATASWNFLKWLTEADQMKKFSANAATYTNSFGILYPRKDLAQELQNDSDLKVFNQALPFAQSWYMGSGAQVRQEFAKILDNNSISSGDMATLESIVQTIISNKGKI